MDGKLVIPFTLRNAMMETLHETHPGQLGMKYLAQYIWCDSNNIKLIFCTGDHRSNGLVEKLVNTAKIKLLAMSQEAQKCALQDAVSKISWNLRSS